MIHVNVPRRALLLVALLSTIPWVDAGCTSHSEDVPFRGPPTFEPDIAPDPVTASFAVKLDPNDSRLTRDLSEPVADVAEVHGADANDVRLKVHARKIPARPDDIELSVYVENTSDHALRDVEVAVRDITGTDTLYDFTNEPLAAGSDVRKLRVGGIEPRGVGRVVLGFKKGTSELGVSLDVTATKTSRVARSSGPVQVTPDGREVWAAWPDADVVTIVDTATDTRAAQLQIKGRPSSVAVTPDGRLVLVASATTNTVTVIERATRRVIQEIGEKDGIGREPRELVVSPDGGRAFVSAYVGDSVTALVRTGDRYWVEHVTPVGRRPTGMSVSQDSQTLYVAHFLPRGAVVDNQGWASVLDASTLTPRPDLIVRDTFSGEQLDCLAKLIEVAPQRLTSESAPTAMFGFFLNPSGTRGFVPSTRNNAIPVWERGPRAEGIPLIGFGKGRFTSPLIQMFDTRFSDRPTTMKLPAVVDAPNVNTPYVTCASLDLELSISTQRPIPSKPGWTAANPGDAYPGSHEALSETGIVRAVAFTRGGRRALFVSHAADEVVVYDAMTLHPTSRRHFSLSGSNPSGMTVTPDGKKAYVTYDNSTFLSVLDLSAYANTENLPEPSYVPFGFKEISEIGPATASVLSRLRLVRDASQVQETPSLRELRTVSLMEVDPLEPSARRGRVLFYSSNPDKYPTLTASRMGACASCHLNGGNDGTMWGTMEGERKTMSLRGGVENRGWLHISATHANAHEFVDTIVTERLGGKLSPDDVNALAGYVSQGIPALQPAAVDEALAERGHALFDEHCKGCHSDTASSSAPPMLYDLGTATDNASALIGSYFESVFTEQQATLVRAVRGDRALGAGDSVQQTLDFRPRPERARGHFKAPSLTNIWDSALFFHDGRYGTLKEAVHAMNRLTSGSLSEADELAVVEYLKTK